MQWSKWISQDPADGIGPLKIINVKDVKLGGTCGREAGEAAFGGDMFCVTSVSSDARFMCPVSCATLEH